MADILDQAGYGDMPVSGIYTLTGQTMFLDGGGLRAQLVAATSENSQLEPIQHRAIVPFPLARNDSATMEHALTQDSLGTVNQPVSGGIVAPPGIIPPDQYTTLYDGMGDGQLGSIPAPSSTSSMSW